MSMNGAELRAIRQQLGFSLTQFAPQLGIHWNTLARFERGEINISGPVEKLARLLLELAAAEQKKPKQRNRKSKGLEK
jgi:DNA-binding transcriptional regulator YiaG